MPSLLYTELSDNGSQLGKLDLFEALSRGNFQIVESQDYPWNLLFSYNSIHSIMLWYEYGQLYSKA